MNNSIDLILQTLPFSRPDVCPHIIAVRLADLSRLYHATHVTIGVAASTRSLHAHCTERGLSEVLTDGAPVR